MWCRGFMGWVEERGGAVKVEGEGSLGGRVERDGAVVCRGVVGRDIAVGSCVVEGGEG